MNSDDLIMAIILTSALVTTVAVIWIRKNVPPDLPPKEAISFALRKFAYKGGIPPTEQSAKPQKQEAPKQPPQPPKDEPTVGTSYTGGFGSGMPFIDALSGMTVPQPVTTDITFDVSIFASFKLVYAKSRYFTAFRMWRACMQPNRK